MTAAACAGLLAVTGCSGSDGGSGDDQQKTTVTVFAAASLTDVFGELEKDFEAEHPDVDIVLTTGGSPSLVTQIDQGAPADVLATADEANMKDATDKKLVESPQTFATNELAIAVAPGNPHHIKNLASLENPDLLTVRCAAPVPCGSVSDAVLKDAGVTLKPASEEQSVTDVLTKVTAGEADAGLVYVTDVKRAGDKAEAVAIPEAADHATDYPIAVASESEHPDLAQDFIDLVRSDKGMKVLKDAGFGAP